MKSLNLIITREYVSRVKTKAFLLTTILTPILMIASFLVPSIIASMKSGDIKDIYVCDKTGVYAPYLKDTKDFSFIVVDDEPNMKERKGEGFALLNIDADLSVTPSAVTFYSEKQQPPAHIISYINNKLTDAVKSKRLKSYTEKNNISDEATQEIMSISEKTNIVNVTTFRLTENDEAVDTVSHLASIIGIAFTLLMFFFVLMYGSIVMQSVVEEKTNRIVEVIISSVKPFTLMMGKIIAVALMGLTQIVFWIVLMGIVYGVLAIFGMTDISSSSVEGLEENKVVMTMISSQMESLMAINWLQMAICFIFYFIGGYLLYASLFAMFGAAANDSQEAQQYSTPLSIVLIIALYVGMAAAKDPEGTTALWASMIPFTSPVVMMVRTPLEVPIWQIIVSIVLLFATAFAMIFVASKIYRTGILMYGKKTNIKEICKWLFYKN